MPRPNRIKFHIDEEFRSLVPPPSQEEEKQLEANIVASGRAEEPLLVWWDGTKNLLIDGHTRWKIVKEKNLPYRTELRNFASRNEVMIWIIHHQLGRRNLNTENYRYLRGKEYLLTPGKENAQRIARASQVSTRTIQSDAKFAKNVDTIAKDSPEIANEIKSKSKLSQEEVQELADAHADIRKEILEAVERTRKKNQQEAVLKRKDTEQADLRKELPLPKVVVSAKDCETAKRAIEALVRMVRMLDSIGLTDRHHAALERLMNDLRVYTEKTSA